MRKRFQPMAEINVVPYIDVMLVLVVILMITTPLLTQGVKVSLPSAHAKAIQQKGTPPLIISVNEQGLYFLNVNAKPTQHMATDALLVRVAAEHQIDPQRMILVKGDQGVAYGKVIELMAMLQNAGVDQVGMLTKPLSDTA